MATRASGTFPATSRRLPGVGGLPLNVDAVQTQVRVRLGGLERRLDPIHVPLVGLQLVIAVHDLARGGVHRVRQLGRTLLGTNTRARHHPFSGTGLGHTNAELPNLGTVLVEPARLVRGQDVPVQRHRLIQQPRDSHGYFPSLSASAMALALAACVRTSRSFWLLACCSLILACWTRVLLPSDTGVLLDTRSDLEDASRVLTSC